MKKQNAQSIRFLHFTRGRQQPAFILSTYIAAILFALAGIPKAETLTDAESVIQEPKVIPLKMREHDNHRGLYATFSLLNSLIEYGVIYRVCNDVEAHDETDLRRAWGQFLPGIGFNKPNVASWYYNNYSKILLDDLPLGDYILQGLREENADGTAKVVATWETPKCKVDLTFALMRDHTGVFQELKIYDAKEPISHVTVDLGGYYWGLSPEDNKSDGFVTVDPSGQDQWVLMGNKVREAPVGIGPCALLVLPEELESVKFGRPCSLEKAANVQPGQTATIRWVLWMFPQSTNDQALEYMSKEAANTRERLINLFKTNQ